MKKSYLQALLAQGNFRAIFQILNHISNKIPSHQLRDDIILHSGLWHEHHRKENQGIYSSKSLKRMDNHVRLALNYLINELTDEEYQVPEELLASVETTQQSIESFLEPNVLTVAPPGIILFLAANPTVLKDNFDSEHSKVARAIQTDGKRRFQVEAKFTVSYQEVTNAINAFKPVIIHFVGHGLQGNPEKQNEAALLGIPELDGSGIFMHAEDKRAGQVVSTEELDRLFERLCRRYKQLTGVVLNACFSAPQAETISKHGLWAVGTTQGITNAAAATFSAAFYHQLARDSNFKEALNAGIDAAVIKDHNFEKKIHLFYNGQKVNL